MAGIITFGTLAIRDIDGYNAPQYGNWSWQTSELDAIVNEIAFEQLVFAAPVKGDVAAAQATVAADTYLVGGSNHIQHQEFFAIVNTTGVAGVLDAGDTLYKLSDTGYGSTLTSLAASNPDDGADPVLVRGHGKLNNNTTHDGLTTSGVRFSNANGFGFDNGPEGADRAQFLNDGDSITFTTQAGLGIKKASFTVKVHNGGTETNVVLDTDGVTIRTLDPLKQGLWVQDASAGELNLGPVANGTQVEIDFDLGILTIGGNPFAGNAAAFFAAFNGQLDQLTLGSLVGNQTGWTALGVQLETIEVGPVGVPPVFGPGLPVLSLDTFSRPDGNASPVPGELNNERHTHAYLDIDGDNVLDADELPTIEKLALNNTDSSGDGDINPLQGDGNAGPRNDLMDLYFRGIADTLSPSGHQYGDMRLQAMGADGGAFSLGIDTASPPDVLTGEGPNGSPADISAGTGNLGDESGGSHINTGEVVGVVLKSGLAATAVRIQYAGGTDLTPGSVADIIVRLYQGSTLIETFTYDIGADTSMAAEAGDFIVSDNFGQAFDRIEIQAAGSSNGVGVTDPGARFALTDLDFLIEGLDAESGPTLRAVHEANGTKLFVDGTASGEFDPASPNGNNGAVVNVNGLIELRALNADGSAAQIRFDQGESIAVDGTGNADAAKRIDLGETLRITRLDGASTEASVTIRTSASSYGTGNEVKLVLRNGDVVVGERFFDLVDAAPTGDIEFDLLSFTSTLAFDTIDVVANAAQSSFTVDQVFFM